MKVVWSQQPWERELSMGHLRNDWNLKGQGVKSRKRELTFVRWLLYQFSAVIVWQGPNWVVFYLKNFFVVSVGYFKSPYCISYKIAIVVFYVLVFGLQLWDLSFRTRDWTHTLCVGRRSLNTACMHAVLSLCNLMDCGPPGSSVHGILQARILEWVAMPSSRRSSWPRDWTRVSCGSCIAGGFFTTEPPGKPCLNHWTTPNWLPMFNLSFNLETSYQYLTSWTLHSYHLLGDSNNQERLEIIGLLKTRALLGTILFWFIILECIPTLI